MILHPLHEIAEPVPTTESYVPQDNEIVATCSAELTISDLASAYAHTLCKLGHVDVHVYVVEYNSAVEIRNIAYATEVLRCMAADIKTMSPPDLVFGVHSFPLRGHNLYHGWRKRGEPGVYGK